MGGVVNTAVGLYAELEALPETLVGEIIDGRLVTRRIYEGTTTFARMALVGWIGPAYNLGRDGPGGWWIIGRPELHLIRDREVLVPEVGGWLRARMPYLPRDQRFEVVPDWVCEILSPSTAKLDRAEKMPLYARYGVRHLWLVDPLLKTLEVYELHEGRWSNLGNFKDDDEVSIAPFEAISIQLADLWLPDEEDANP